MHACTTWCLKLVCKSEFKTIDADRNSSAKQTILFRPHKQITHDRFSKRLEFPKRFVTEKAFNEIQTTLRRDWRRPKCKFCIFTKGPKGRRSAQYKGGLGL